MSGKLHIRETTASRFDAMFGASSMLFRMGGETVITVCRDGTVYVLGERVPNLMTDIRAWGKPGVA
jgi:hypothetical protein